LPAAILYTERRLDGLEPAERDRVMRQIEVNSWDDFDGLAEWALVVAVATALGTAVGVVLSTAHHPAAAMDGMLADATEVQSLLGAHVGRSAMTAEERFAPGSRRC
jgi:hypothetical protein